MPQVDMTPRLRGVQNRASFIKLALGRQTFGPAGRVGWPLAHSKDGGGPVSVVAVDDD